MNYFKYRKRDQDNVLMSLALHLWETGGKLATETRIFYQNYSKTTPEMQIPVILIFVSGACYAMPTKAKSLFCLGATTTTGACAFSHSAPSGLTHHPRANAAFVKSYQASDVPLHPSTALFGLAADKEKASKVLRGHKEALKDWDREDAHKALKLA